MWIKNLGSLLAGRALPDERDWIVSLLEPFISNRMIKQNTHKVAYFCLGGISQGDFRLSDVTVAASFQRR